MQEVGNVQSGGYRARVLNAASREGSDSGQVRRRAGPERARKTGFAEDSAEDRSSDKLKDALLVSFLDWFSEHFTTGSKTPEMSSASEGKPERGAGREIVADQTADRVAEEIASNRPLSLLLQANVTQDTALYLLSAGALAETVQEPGQKPHTLFDADYMDLRTKTAKMPNTPV